VDDLRARELVAGVEGLLAELEALAEPAARDTATAAVQGILDIYGEALARVVECGGAERLVEDELIAHLLIVHGLHPTPLRERVLAALDEVRPYLESHGGDVELAGVEEGVVRLRMQGSCDGCPSSSATLQLAIEDAIRKAAPDVEQIEAEGGPEPEGERRNGQGLPLATWTMVGGLPELNGGGRTLRRAGGELLLFVKLTRALYAYRPSCPACGASLQEAQLDGAQLCCNACAHRYDVRRAGRCVDDDALHLEPVPLLADSAGLVKVALGAPA
jgi:Fe-S cluster biogenesis protein NfuA/nitrite reductase/ring-hydroxylating ferredoxin subunit